MDTGPAQTGQVGSREALMEAIVVEYETPLLQYATRILRNSAAAEDVVQEVFVKLFRDLQDGASPTDKMKAWLFRVTHNEVVDYIRRESRLRNLHDKTGQETAFSTADQDCGETEEEKRELVMEHVQQLDEREKQVLLLRLDQGLSYTEISSVTGRTEGNVGNILHHAVRKLAASLKQAGVVKP